jgi:hypothetical protein
LLLLTYNDGNTLIVARGLELEHLGGQVQQQRNQNIFSEEAKQNRKSQKNQRKNR